MLARQMLEETTQSSIASPYLESELHLVYLPSGEASSWMWRSFMQGWSRQFPYVLYVGLPCEHGTEENRFYMKLGCDM